MVFDCTCINKILYFIFLQFLVYLIHYVYFRWLVTVVIVEGALVDQVDEGNESAVNKQKPVL